MSDRKFQPHPISRRNFTALLLSALLLLRIGVPLFAADDQPYLAAGHPDGVALLGPPPEPGSAEQAADLATVRAVFKARTSDEEARAMSEEASLGVYNFTPAIGPFFKPGKFPKIEALLEKCVAEGALVARVPKNHYQRKRPCQIDPALNIGEPEKGFSYPSGHSTAGTIDALILAEIFPEHKDAILAIGRQIGWDRVLIGKHFPTDIRAGRVLAQAIVRELHTSPAFESDLAAAKAEAQAALLLPLPSTGRGPG